jgi:hypothetical protein
VNRAERRRRGLTKSQQSAVPQNGSSSEFASRFKKVFAEPLQFWQRKYGRPLPNFELEDGQPNTDPDAMACFVMPNRIVICQPFLRRTLDKGQYDILCRLLFHELAHYYYQHPIASTAEQSITNEDLADHRSIEDWTELFKLPSEDKDIRRLREIFHQDNLDEARKRFPTGSAQQ